MIPINDASDLIYNRRAAKQTSETHLKLANEASKSYFELSEQLRQVLKQEGSLHYDGKIHLLGKHDEIVEIPAKFAYQVKIESPADEPAPATAE